jgi:hypothetical protein
MKNVTNNILQSIRKTTNEINAGYVRSTAVEDIKTCVRDATMKVLEERAVEEIHQFIDTLLLIASTRGVDSVAHLVPDIQGSGPAAREARNAIVEASVISGQYIKASVVQTLSPFVRNLQARVAETICTVISEAMVTSAMSKGTKALPAPEAH